MKRIFLSIILIYMAVIINSQKFSQDQISFSSQFQGPNSLYSSDRSIYVSPDSQTSIPFYSVNNMNKFPSNFFSQTQSKAPSHFSTPFSVIMSSTLRPNTDDDDDEDDEHDERFKYRTLVPNFTINNHMNQTIKKIDRQMLEKRDKQANSRMVNFPSQQEKVHPNQYLSIATKDTSNKQNSNSVQNPAARRMIVTSEIQRSDRGPDQVKAGSFQNTQYVQAPGVFISSTTEPAIPILRLSNEMDLDGSFSYEALGADQTHYVQHSRMENMGTDKEEQVVEGSYSYVGDDGRTYTVHYVADSNGYRATGEHLPSPPPIPEIIQRAVQYNLAEEARKPPHMRASWENEENEYQIKEESRHNPFSIPLQRNLFTGKTPEAFSFGFAQNVNPQNNLVTAPSFHIPSKSNHETSHDQLKSKINNGPISPQITFLASQGAHSPSLHQQKSQPTVPKTENSDKLPLPQLMNYEADIKESEHDGNKGLWRWQYGLNANSNQVANKNSISRSFAEGDDVMINFSDMTPEQYTQMIQNQMSAIKTVDSNKMEGDNGNLYFTSYSSTVPKENEIINNDNTQSVTVINNNINDKNQIIASTQTYDWYSQEPVKFKNQNIGSTQTDDLYSQEPVKFKNQNIGSTQTYDLYSQEPVKIKNQNIGSTQTYDWYSQEPVKFKNQNIGSTQTYDMYSQEPVKFKNQIIESTPTYNLYSQEPIKYSNTESNNKIYQYISPLPDISTMQPEQTDSRSKIISVNNFAPRSQMVTQSYAFEETQFEPTKIRKNKENSTSNLNYSGSFQNNEYKYSQQFHEDFTTPLSISNNDVNITPFNYYQSSFKPIIYKSEYKQDIPAQVTTTTEASVAELIKDNIFLRNLFKTPYSIEKLKQDFALTDENNQLNTAEPTTKKPTQLIELTQNPLNEVKNIKTEPMNVNDVLNYVVMKNHFESIKTKPKSKSHTIQYINHLNEKEPARYIPVNKDNNQSQEDGIREDSKEYAALNRQQQLELRGLIKNYKVLQRQKNTGQKTQMLHEPQRHIKIFHPPGLPPLGRAGPSMKSYLPPTYI